MVSYNPASGWDAPYTITFVGCLTWAPLGALIPKEKRCLERWSVHPEAAFLSSVAPTPARHPLASEPWF